MQKHTILVIIAISLLFACNKEEASDDCIQSDFFSEYSSRDFDMGFSTWAYAPTLESIDNTYQFVSNNVDIYSEHIDYNIPWNAWINDLSLPSQFTDEIALKVARRIPNIKLTVSATK